MPLVSPRHPQEDFRTGLKELRASLAPDLCRLCRICLYDMLAGGHWASELWQVETEGECGSDMRFRHHRVAVLLASEKLDCPMCRLLNETLRQFRELNADNEVCIVVYKNLKADRMIDAFGVDAGQDSRERIEFILWTVTEEKTVLGGKYHTSGPPMNPGRHFPLVKPSTRDPGPVDSFLETMVQNCDSHPLCSVGVTHLPTRVIDVGKDGFERPFILETQKKPGQYVALSYCWGRRSDHITTMDNLERRRHGITTSELPTTLQDAIVFCQRNSFRYLWIDALCIIQDSELDWEQEVAQMSTYYSHALCVLYASEGDNSDGGLLFQRSVRVTIPSGSIYVQHRDQDDGRRREPLVHRAWTLQERFLARAVLAYMTHPDSDPKAQAQLWETTVDQFCNRALSFHKDKLAALAGIAEMFQRHGWKTGRYLAGLWECDLYLAHLWCGLLSHRQTISNL